MTAVRIDGVQVLQNAIIGDERGVIMELIDGREPYWNQPVPYLYLVTCRPGKAKGWGWHAKHDDRYMVLAGELIVVLYDDREDSPTKGVVQEFYMTREGLNQLQIPRGVWHAHMNVGLVDAMMVNAPTQAFQHNDPDKRTLPLDSDQIPYRFDTGLGH